MQIWHANANEDSGRHNTGKLLCASHGRTPKVFQRIHKQPKPISLMIYAAAQEQNI